MGWNPGLDRDIFTFQELIDLFSFEHVSKAGARFAYEKAKWYNHEYLINKTDEEVTELFMPILAEHNVQCDTEKAKYIVSLVKGRLNFAKDLWNETSFFFERPTAYDEKSIKKRWKPESPEILNGLCDILDRISDFSSANTEAIVMKWIEDNGYNTGTVMNSFRITVVGAAKGPHMFDITAILGKEETISRVKAALEVIK